MKASVFYHAAFFMDQLSHSYMTTGKAIALTMWTFVDKLTSCFLIHSLVYYNFPSREQVSFNFMAAVTVHSDFEAQKSKIFHFFPFFCHEVMGPDTRTLVFLMLSFKSAFHSPLSPSSRGSLVPLQFLPLK